MPPSCPVVDNFFCNRTALIPLCSRARNVNVCICEYKQDAGLAR
jgi:hypothetical protein